MRRLALYPLSCFVGVVVLVGSVCAEQPLHQRIDSMVEPQLDGIPLARSSDGEFLRRIHLDLIGRIPARDEAIAFLDDTEDNKRERLIDRLLQSDEHPRRMSEVFHVMLMERMGEHEEWNSYLKSSFDSNKPWDQLAREIAKPNADDETTRGSAYFLTKRLEKYGQNPVDYPGLVRDVGRMFLGVDVQCAQCHDHLFVDDYKQVDYQGLFASVGQAVIRKDVKFPAIAETLVAKPVEFKSVFVMEDDKTGPRLPFSEGIEVPVFAKGEEYETPPDRKTRFPGVPKFSPLEYLSRELPDHPLFRKNIANRIWWLMMGRGLVSPLDLHHSDNSPSHPELLTTLADELAAHDYDLRWLIREVAMSQTYQRSSLLPESPGDDLSDTSYQVSLEKPLSAEQVFRSMLQAVSDGKVVTLDTDNDELTELRTRFTQAFANPPREPEVGHHPSVKAALFLLNDDLVLGLLDPENNNLVDRILKMSDAAEAAEELYLSVLSRHPTQEETGEVRRYLDLQGDQRATACADLAWALLASIEFGVNH